MTVNPRNLTFTTGNWNDPKPVTVTVKEGASSGPVDLTHVIRKSGSRDEEYDHSSVHPVRGGAENNVITVTVRTATFGLTLSPSLLVDKR